MFANWDKLSQVKFHHLGTVCLTVYQWGRLSAAALIIYFKDHMKKINVYDECKYSQAFRNNVGVKKQPLEFIAFLIYFVML